MELNEVGVIAQTHGLKGEVKIKTDSDFINERFSPGCKLYIKEKSGYKELTVKSHRSMLNYELVSFEKIETIEDITPYLNKTLYAEKNEALLSENEYFYSDLIGLKVSQFGEIKGTAKDIESLPQCDYLVVETNDKKEKLVPLLKDFLDKIDTDNGIIYIVDMEDLL